MKFKVVKRNEDECTHDTGICHSLELRWEDVERMALKSHIFESDPLHEQFWHKGVKNDGKAYDVTPTDNED